MKDLCSPWVNHAGARSDDPEDVCQDDPVELDALPEPNILTRATGREVIKGIRCNRWVS